VQRVGDFAVKHAILEGQLGMLLEKSAHLGVIACRGLLGPRRDHWLEERVLLLQVAKLGGCPVERLGGGQCENGSFCPGIMSTGKVIRIE
jgi:hypothetical protein